jgi:hypothetical protein
MGFKIANYVFATKTYLSIEGRERGVGKSLRISQEEEKGKMAVRTINPTFCKKEQFKI